MAEAPERSKSCIVLHVERVAEARIRIDDERDRDALTDLRDDFGHFAHADETDVGAAEARVGNARTGKIGGAEACTLDETGRKGVVAAGRHEDAGRGEARAQGVGHIDDFPCSRLCRFGRRPPSATISSRNAGTGSP